MLLAGCATSTVQSRLQERSAAFNGLSPEQQQLVRQGEIKIGMPEDAVYIAMGPPADVVESESQNGRVKTWIYYGQTVEETRYWTFERTSRGDSAFPERRLESDYFPRSYVRAEIDFVDGKVARWRTLPKPPTR